MNREEIIDFYSSKVVSMIESELNRFANLPEEFGKELEALLGVAIASYLENTQKKP